MLSLFHENILIGRIQNAVADGSALATVGDIELTEEAANYKELLEFFLDDDKRSFEDPPFSNELMENWFIEDEQGHREPIDVPLINENNEIWWT